MRLLFLVAALAIVAGAFPLPAQQHAGVAGCYRFTSPYFTWTIGERWSGTLYSARSSLIELRDEPMPVLSEQGDRRRVTAPGLRDSSAMLEWYRYSNWRPIGSDSIAVSWWSGLAGTTLVLRVYADSLVGASKYMSDVDVGTRTQRDRTRPAHGRRVPCPTPPLP